MNHQQSNIGELASIDMQRVNKEDLVDMSGLYFDPAIPQGLRAACNGKPLLFPRGGAGR